MVVFQLNFINEAFLCFIEGKNTIYFTLMVFSNSFGRAIDAQTLPMNRTALNIAHIVNVCVCWCNINMCAECTLCAHACACVFFFERVAQQQKIRQSFNFI